MNFADFLATIPAKPKPPAKRKPNTHEQVMKFRERHLFGRKETITPDDLLSALQAIYDAFDQRELFGKHGSALTTIWAEDMNIPLEWDAATGHLAVREPEMASGWREEGDRKRYAAFSIKDGRYVLPPAVRAVAQAIAVKQQAYRRKVAAQQRLPMETLPYTLDLKVTPIPMALALRFGPRFAEGEGSIQYDDKGGEPTYKKPLQMDGQEWIQDRLSFSRNEAGLVLLQRVVPRSEWKGPTLTHKEHFRIRDLDLPANREARRAGREMAVGIGVKASENYPNPSASIRLFPGEKIFAGGKPYVGTNELRAVRLPPFSVEYYVGEWYLSKEGEIFGVIGFVRPSGDELTLDIGYGKGKIKVAADRLMVVMADDPTFPIVRTLDHGDERVGDLSGNSMPGKWSHGPGADLSLPIVSTQALAQVRKKAGTRIRLPGQE